jgi:perosamine synthetase
MIRICDVELGPDVEASVLRTQWPGLLSQGPRVAELEERFEVMTGVLYSIAVSSGTAALVATFEALGIGPATR